ncbi:MAG: hypothetical protein ACRD2R_07985, partial [Terriglobales bacterium]
AKVQGRQIVEVAAPQHLAPVVDILEALKMSLAAAKKPARSVEQPPAAAVPIDSAAQGKPRKGRKSSSG